MPKDLINAVGSFGEGFLTTLQSERDRKRNELEFNQRMGLEDRRMRLIDKVRQQDFLYNQQQDKLQAEKDYTNLGSDKSLIPIELQTNMFPASKYPETFGKDNKDFFIPNSEIPEQKEVKTNLEGSYKNPDTKTYWKYDETNRKGVDTLIPYDTNEGRSITNNNSNPTGEKATPPINTVTLDEMIKNYNKRNVDDNEGKIPMGNSLVNPDQWRIEANKVLTAETKDAGLSQELLDKIWEMAKLGEKDTPQVKREKLKNVIDQQPLGDIQKRTLYHYAEVRTR